MKPTTKFEEKNAMKIKQDEDGFYTIYTGLTIENIWKLYDEQPPQFKHSCLNCGDEFISRKKKAICCSRRCSGLLSVKRKKLQSANGRPPDLQSENLGSNPGWSTKL